MSSSAPPVPEMMLAVAIPEFGAPPTTAQIPVPHPGPGQVLVRMAASPVNPSDLAFMKGGYGAQRPFPMIPGFEGSGTVVKAGAGLLPHLLLGKRVACATSADGGMWAEYAVTWATACIPLRKNVSLEQGAMSIVNPMTALAFFDMARRDRHQAIVSTAAAGALGKMILRLGIKNGIPVIHIVQRKEQADVLRSLGAKHVLRNEDPDFMSSFQRLSHEWNATLILDAVGGKLSQQLILAAPFGSTLVAYGFLSGEETAIDLRSLVKENKRVIGFFLPNWLKKRHLFQMAKDFWRIRTLLSSDLATSVRKEFALTSVQEALNLYRTSASAGKVLLIPSQREGLME